MELDLKNNEYLPILLKNKKGVSLWKIDNQCKKTFIANFDKNTMQFSVNILDTLELAEGQLKEDINFLQTIYDKYFAFQSKILDFRGLENCISVLIKSMEYNKTNMKDAIEKIYKKEKINKNFL